jgi:hypothetical protein
MRGDVTVAMMAMMTVRRRPHRDPKPSPQRAQGCLTCFFLFARSLLYPAPSISPSCIHTFLPCRVSVFYMSVVFLFSFALMCHRTFCMLHYQCDERIINQSSISINIMNQENVCVRDDFCLRERKSNLTYISLWVFV